MISTHSRSARQDSRQGFSLIEVAIALVIFVIGALAIIRIFPGALNVINNNGDQQVASNLNSDVLAQLKTEGTVPSATFNIRVNADKTLQWTTADNADHTANYEDISASVIGVPRFNSSLPTTEDINARTGNSALSRFRGIIGEQAKVVTIEENGADIQYVLTQFPLSLEKLNGVANDTIPAPTISQEYIVRNARIDQRNRVTFENATITDANGKEVLLNTNSAQNGVSAGSVIYVSYRYYNTANQIWGVREEAVPISTSTTLQANTPPLVRVSPPTTSRGAIAPYNVANPQPQTGTVAEAVDVRVKRFAFSGEFGPSVGSPAVNAAGFPTTEQVGDARRGLIRLPNAVTTKTVSVDYIADWSYLMQQGIPLVSPSEPPANITLVGNQNFRQLSLGAPFIEDQSSIGIYSLLLAPPLTPPAMAGEFDLHRSRFGTANDNPAPAGKLVRPTEDDLRQSRVTFIVDSSDTKARVAYNTRDSWAQQLAVAANTYTPYALIPGLVTTNIGPRLVEPWRDYYLGNDNYLYFHAGEAGKTISLSYTILVLDDNGNLVPRTVVDKPFVIEDRLLDRPGTVPQAFSNQQVARVQLTNFAGGALPTADLVSIQAVRGTSVTSRTAYINGNKYKQTLLTSYRDNN